jgi:hypothetical protein
MSTPKEQVIRLFLGLLSPHVPLAEARVATLGGQGIEAKIWAESGIPPEHGSLIELNRTQGNRLIENHRYRYHNRLGTFCVNLTGQHGAAAQIDGFHLDLCGTVTEQILSDFAPLLRLILRSTGRCLGVTVADQRRNIALEQWPEVLEKGERLFGGHAAEILENLEAQQQQLPTRDDLPSFMRTFDSHKAACREFGLMVELIGLFQTHRAWAPVEIARYVYVSRYGGKPFRMRSFFFRFARFDPPRSGLDVARTWVTSSLSHHFQPGPFTQITAPSTAMERPIQGEVMSSRLGALANAVGGDTLAEYEMLVRSYENQAMATAVLEKIRELVSPVAPTPVAVAQPTPKAKKGPKKWTDLSEEQRIQWQIKMLELRLSVQTQAEARAENKDAWEKEWEKEWRKLLEEDFGTYSPELGRSLRSVMSRTSGKFRPRFEQQIQKLLGDAAGPYLERLSKIPA